MLLNLRYSPILVYNYLNGTYKKNNQKNLESYSHRGVYHHASNGVSPLLWLKKSPEVNKVGIKNTPTLWSGVAKVKVTAAQNIKALMKRTIAF